MKAWKKFRFAISVITAVTVLLISVSSCKKPCYVPNPLIQFGMAKDTIGVTPNKVYNAQTVQITAFDAFGVAKGNFNVAPGEQQKMRFDTSAHRPIQLVFIYQSATGKTIAEDSIRIDDRVKQGISLPDMDIVVGVSGSQACPTGLNTINPTITTGSNGFKKATFPWVNNEAFEVTLSCGSGTSAITKSFRLNPAPGIGDDAGKVTIYGSANYTCLTLTSTDTQAESKKSMVITAIDDDCNIRGWNDGTTQTISINYPGNCTIAVKH